MNKKFCEKCIIQDNNCTFTLIWSRAEYENVICSTTPTILYIVNMNCSYTQDKGFVSTRKSPFLFSELPQNYTQTLKSTLFFRCQKHVWATHMWTRHVFFLWPVLFSNDYLPAYKIPIKYTTEFRLEPFFH